MGCIFDSRGDELKLIMAVWIRASSIETEKYLARV